MLIYTNIDKVKSYLIEELVKQFNVEEHCRRVRQLVSNDVQKYFGAENIVARTGSTPFGPECGKTEFQDPDTVLV